MLSNNGLMVPSPFADCPMQRCYFGLWHIPQPLLHIALCFDKQVACSENQIDLPEKPWMLSGTTVSSTSRKQLLLWQPCWI